MDTLESYDLNRTIIKDFTSRSLAAIPTDFGRLLYLSSLRDLASGRYLHEGLLAMYPEEAVQQGLNFCHQEIFFRVLEGQLEHQEWDLRSCVAALEGEFWGKLARCRETQFYRLLVPADTPPYLRELFHARVGALLDLLLEERASSERDA